MQSHLCRSLRIFHSARFFSRTIIRHTAILDHTTTRSDHPEFCEIDFVKKDSIDKKPSPRKQRSQKIEASKIINTLCSEKKIDEALDCLVYYSRSGVSFDAQLFTPILDVLADEGKTNMLKRFMHDMQHYYKVKPDLHHHNILLRALCKESMEKAKEYFDNMKEKTARTYLTFISGATNRIRGPEDVEYMKMAQDAFIQLLEKYPKPSIEICRQMTVGFSNLKQERYALQMIRVMEHYGVTNDPVVTETVVKLLCEEGKFDEAKQLCNSQVGMNTIVKLFAEKGDWRQAAQSFDELCESGKNPDTQTYNALLSAYSKKAGKEVKMKNLFEHMKQNGVTPDEQTVTIMLKSHLRANQFTQANELFQEHKRNTEGYNELLMYCLRNKPDQVADLLKQMKTENVPQDEWTKELIMQSYV